MGIINKYFAVGSDGFIALKDVMGSDESIEQAARISYGKGTRKRSETRGLLRYLKRNLHTSPFEQAELQFHIRVPMHIWRQWIRHRTANVNEYSTRYSEAIDARETTDPDKWRLQSTTNKQGSGEYLDLKTGVQLSGVEDALHKWSMEVYQERIDAGVAREQARKDLPLSTYTEAFWKCDLHNLMHFCSLRCDSHAQLEIREYANVIAGIIKETFPLSFEAWYDYQFQSVNFTRLDRELLHWIYIDGGYVETIDEVIKEHAKEIGMSDREISEFWNKIKTPEEKDFSLDNLPLYEGEINE